VAKFTNAANKRMQTERSTRYASETAADAKRYAE